MKKLLFLFLTLPFLGLSQNNSSVQKNGFADYVFGSPASDYKNLTLEIDEGNSKLYSVSSASTIKGVELSETNLTFLKNKLSVICLKTKNASGAGLLSKLKESYGEPSTSIAAKGNHEWLKDNMRVIYEQDKTGKDATVSFYSRDPSKNKH